MTTSDVPPDEMGWDPNATDDALEQMLSGQTPTSDEWRELAGFVEDLHEAAPARPLVSEDLHVAAMVETSHLIAENGDPVVRPVSNADAPAPQVSRLPKLRRKPMKRSTRTLVRVLAPIAAIFTVMGSMAVAGALPHPVQKAVSHAAGTVGLNLPGDDESTDVPDQDDQGENADDQGDNDDNQGDSSTTDTAITTNDQGDQSESSDTQTSADDQGENDDSQGDNDNQGEDSQGDSTDQTSGDDQGDTTQSGGDQGDQGSDTQGDGSDQSSGDQQGGDNQD